MSSGVVRRPAPGAGAGWAVGTLAWVLVFGLVSLGVQLAVRSAEARSGTAAVDLDTAVTLLLVVGGAAVVAGCVDGWWGWPPRPLVLRWLVVALTVGLFVPANNLLRAGTFDPATVATDLFLVMPFYAASFFALACVPALLVSSWSARRRRRRERQGRS